MILHIDMSNHYRQKTYSVIAMVSGDNVLMKRVIFEEPARSLLFSKYKDVELHAALICLLLKGIQSIEKIIVCADVLPIEKVFGHASNIRPDLLLGKFQSIIELRRYTGQPRLKSAADALAKRINRAYPKRNNIHRRNKVFEEAEIEMIRHKNAPSYKWIEEKLRGIIESNR